MMPFLLSLNRLLDQSAERTPNPEKTPNSLSESAVTAPAWPGNGAEAASSDAGTDALECRGGLSQQVQPACFSRPVP